jgi:hypothetical protein
MDLLDLNLRPSHESPLWHLLLLLPLPGLPKLA